MKPRPPWLLAAGGVVGYLALAAALADMRMELNALRAEAAAEAAATPEPRRGLLPSDNDDSPLGATVTHLGDRLDGLYHLHDTLGSRLAAVEQREDELAASLQALRAEAQEDGSNEKEQRDRRRAQHGGDDMDDHAGEVHARNAQIITRAVRLTATDPDSSACDSELAVCTKARHASKGNCLLCVASHDTSSCSPGAVDNFCNGDSRRRLQGAAPGTSLAQQLSVQCTDASLSDAQCIPECTADLHGFVLLLNIAGSDSKLTCEQHSGLYSWVCPAVEGGYLGSDTALFMSSLGSTAVGFFAVVLKQDANISTDVFVHSGQTASITGDNLLPEPPKWQGYGFVVLADASLSLTYIAAAGCVRSPIRPHHAGCFSVSGAGGSVSIASVVMPADTLQAIIGPGGTLDRCGELGPDEVVGVAIGSGHQEAHSLAGATFAIRDVCGLTGTTTACVGEEGWCPSRCLSPDGVDCSCPPDPPTRSSDPPDLFDGMSWTNDCDDSGSNTPGGGSGSVAGFPTGAAPIPELPPPAGTWSVWNSGSVRNANGRTFSLRLLPEQPANTFSNTREGRDAYMALCHDAGLMPIVTGDLDYAFPIFDADPESCRPRGCSVRQRFACADHGCVPLVPVNFGALTVKTDYGAYFAVDWVGDNIGWHDAVALGTNANGDWLLNGIGQMDGGWDEQLRPVCGLENDDCTVNCRGCDGIMNSEAVRDACGRCTTSTGDFLVHTGFCRAADGTSHVNGKVKDDVSDGDCAGECLSLGAAVCVGYSYVFIGAFAERCVIYGPGVEAGLLDLGSDYPNGESASSWHAAAAPDTLIGGADGSSNELCYQRQAVGSSTPCDDDGDDGEGR